MLVLVVLMLFQTKDITLSASQMDLAGARSLIQQGADVNGFNGVGETALMLAAKTGYNDMVKLLLENGARTESVSRLGETPLFYGVRMGRLEVLRSLIEAKAP